MSVLHRMSVRRRARDGALRQHFRRFDLCSAREPAL